MLLDTSNWRILTLTFASGHVLLSLFIHSFKRKQTGNIEKNNTLGARTLVKSSQDGYIRIWRGWCNGSVLPYHIPCPGSRTFDDILIYDKCRWARSDSGYGCVLTLSFPLDNNVTDGCQCTPCVEQRKRISKQEKGTLFNPKISRKWVVVPTISWFPSLHLPLQGMFLARGMVTIRICVLSGIVLESRKQNLQPLRNSWH